MIVLESVFLSVTGTITGCLLSILLIYITGQSGLDLSRFSDGLALYGVGNIIYPTIGQWPEQQAHAPRHRVRSWPTGLARPRPAA